MRVKEATTRRRPRPESARHLSVAPNLNQLVHDRQRLGILSALSVNDSFTLDGLRKLLETSEGELSPQVRKLEKAGYLVCAESPSGRIPRKAWRLSSTGRGALDDYLDHMQSLIDSMRGHDAGTPATDKPTVARHLVLELHDPDTGRLDARRIATYLNTSLSSLAAVTGGSVAAIHKSPNASSLQMSLAPIAQTISLLAEVLQSKKDVQAWLHSPHPDLDNQVPMNLILRGHAGAVADMLAAAVAGQPS